jgi:ATP-dependent exoDNAse (exonuclease V) beta subunit
MDDIIAATRIFEALPFTNRGNFEADCLRMFRAHAQQWQDQGGVGLHEYLQWVDSVVENGHRTALPEPDDREDNAVRLMTTFQAKGLEFPIVALAGMSHASGSHDPMLGITGPNRFEFRLSKLQMSSGYPRWYEDEYQPRKRAEDTRIMYVAFTRARDHLIISLAGERISFRKKDGQLKKKPSYASLLWPSMDPADTDVTVIPTEIEPISLPDLDPFTVLETEWLNTIDDIREASAQKWVASPSGLGAIALGVDVTAEVIDDQLVDQHEVSVDPARGLRNGSALGQSVHRALDVLVRETSPSPQRVDDVCQEMAEQEEVMAHIETVIAMVNAALSCETIAQARAADGLWTELYVAAPVEHEHVKVVDGLVDLVYRDDLGIHIIDYKTDASIGDHNLPHYREQLSAYAEMMRRSTGEDRITAAVLHLTETSAELIPIN